MANFKPFKSLFITPDCEAAFNVWLEKEENRLLNPILTTSYKPGTPDWKKQYIVGCLLGFEPPTKKVSKCKLCPLYRTACTCKVQSRGSENPILLLVGEAPGPDEDMKGTCFVGKSGKLLNDILEKCRIPLKAVRITNILRCIPWGGDGKVRKPDPDEMALCAPYLWEEIQKYNPGLIVPLGASATSALLSQEDWLGCKGKIGKARGKTFEIEIGGKTWSVFPTYHPAAALHGKSSCRFDIEGDLRTAYTGEVITRSLNTDPTFPLGPGLKSESP